jgi:hypothetical protein
MHSSHRTTIHPSHIIRFVGTLICFYGCLVLGINLVSNTVLMIQGQHWLATTGIIEHKGVTVISSGGYKSMPWVCSRISYHFTVGKREYQGSHFSIPDTCSPFWSGTAIAMADYSDGHSATLYFDPGNPELSAVLRPNLDYLYIAIRLFLLGCLATLIVAMMTPRVAGSTHGERIGKGRCGSTDGK